MATTAPKLAPLNALEWYAKAHAALARGDRNTAINLLEKAVSVDPESPEIYEELGKASTSHWPTFAWRCRPPNTPRTTNPPPSSISSLPACCSEKATTARRWISTPGSSSAWTAPASRRIRTRNC